MSAQLPPRRNGAPPAGLDSDQNRAEVDDHYSFDEMVSSLREQEREKDRQGEIVTRSDGSQMRKVRKRKRRSDQVGSAAKANKAKEELLRKKRFKIQAISFFALVMILVLAGVARVLQFNGQGFEAKAQKVAGEATGAKVELDGLGFFPGTINARAATFTWPDSSLIKSLTLGPVEGHLGAVPFATGKMGGREVGGTQGTLKLGASSGSDKLKTDLEKTQEFDFHRFFCKRLSAEFGSTGFAKASNVHASLRNLQNNQWQLHLDEGVLAVEGWAPFPVDVGILKFGRGVAEITSLRLDRPEGFAPQAHAYDSIFVLKGSVPLEMGAQATLAAELKEFPLGAMLGQQLGQLFTGTVRNLSSPGSITFTVGENAIDDVTLPFVAESISLNRFPFVQDLDEFFPEQGFARLTLLSNTAGVFKKVGSSYLIEDLTGDRYEVLRLRGNVEATKEGALSGQIQLMISRGLLAGNPALENNAFLRSGELRGGFIVAKINLGGTVKYPEDNFRSQLGDVSTSSGQVLPPIENQGLESLFDDLTNPAGTVPVPVPSTAEDPLFRDNTSD